MQAFMEMNEMSLCRRKAAMVFFNCLTRNDDLVPAERYGLPLGEVGEIEVQMYSFAQKFNRRTAVEFSTVPAILPNCFQWFVAFIC